MTAKTAIREGDIENLRHVVEAQLEELHVLVDNLELSGSIDINARDVLLDLSYKLENILYCRSNCYCVNPLKDAYDFACNIARVGNIVHASDITTIGERVAKLIHNYVWEYEEPWESDE